MGVFAPPPPLHPQAPEVHFLVNQRLILNKVNQ